jgi:hypothetical protein
MLCSRVSDDEIKLSDPLKEFCGVLKCVWMHRVTVLAHKTCVCIRYRDVYILQPITYVAFPTIKYKLHIHDI